MYLLAFVAPIAWGSLAILISLIKADTNKQLMGISLGAFVSSLIFLSYVTPKSFIVGIIGGLLWTVGLYFQAECFKENGVSTTMPISTALQLISTTTIAILFFAELRNSLWGAALFILFLIIGVFLSSYKQDKKDSRVNKTFVFQIVISTFGFVVYVSIFRAFNVDVRGGMLPQTMGMIIGSLLFNSKNLSALKDKKVIHSMIIGVVYFIGNVSMFLASSKIGVSVAFAISQLNVAVASILALLILKEKKTKKELFFTIIGIILIVSSGIGLALLK